MCSALLDFGVLIQGTPGDQIPFYDLNLAEDNAEEIIEIVGDPPGKAADDLHLLGHAQLPFQDTPLRHVLIDAQRTKHSSLHRQLPEVELNIDVAAIFSPPTCGQADRRSIRGPS